MLRKTALCIVSAAGIAIAQTPPPRLQFGAELVKLNKSGAAEPSGGILPGGEFSVTDMSLIGIMQFRRPPRLAQLQAHLKINPKIRWST